MYFTVQSNAPNSWKTVTNIEASLRELNLHYTLTNIMQIQKQLVVIFSVKTNLLRYSKMLHAVD